MINKKRVVIKIGTSSLTHSDGAMNLRSIDVLARVLSDVHNMGHEVVLVSSGAIAVGVGKLKLKERPKELSLKQAAAAVGQCELMHLYDKFFSEYGNTVAQILLTGEDVYYESTKQNLMNTFNSLLDLGVIPVVNENDSVSHAEIERPGEERHVFGDNDSLSAEVAVLCHADTLILLSDIEGLYDANPKDNANAKLISKVEVIDENIKKLAGGAGSNRGTGGMITKREAAKLATENGIDMYICNGENKENIYDILEGKEVGTHFLRR